MKSLLSVSAVALVAAGLCVAAAAPASARCSRFVGTADGWDKADALYGAQSALAGSITEFRVKNKRRVTVRASRAKPRPYWRESVSANLFLKPDVVTARSHTVCWKGVISPVVCTAGARVCW